MEWNAIAVPQERCFRESWRYLEAFGAVQKTGYLNVLALKTADPPRAFLDALAADLARDPSNADLLARVAPAEGTFTFQDVPDFDARAREALLPRVRELDGRSFHLRIHRRGFKQGFDRMKRERILGEALLDDTIAHGTPARIAFDDSDIVIAIEMVNGRAGFALWTREELARWPLLQPG
jgi:tRNA(Ser,Leu) C12 N-acetylase TAN1